MRLFFNRTAKPGPRQARKLDELRSMDASDRADIGITLADIDRIATRLAQGGV